VGLSGTLGKRGGLIGTQRKEYLAIRHALEQAGARLASWSPIADTALREADGLYFGSGCPELYRCELAAKKSMREAARVFARSGRPVYAERGGLMYLAESLTYLDVLVPCWPPLASRDLS
jgi:cobyrinic acid a,c-diamide synthase